jgi:hypothetical protein
MPLTTSAVQTAAVIPIRQITFSCGFFYPFFYLLSSNHFLVLKRKKKIYDKTELKVLSKE